TGLETLSVRMEKHCKNAEILAEFLKDHEKVNWVKYPKLKNHVSHEIAKDYLNNGYGAVITFGVEGGHEAGKELIENVELISFSANVGDTKSLIIHPSSTTHKQLSAEEKLDAGITEDMVRLSVGIEDISDVKDDLDERLKKL
ncbi:MAG: O-acetylhomoserine aminocarboxypropyltransferase/cysteine synthase, partial [Candidatus Thermoplasmatota archaeon]|nr:O-acetylhomoserine aminocarboxypropyltransferase/cysteine synthase [Candidatus Thermoplasmatota archaeon]